MLLASLHALFILLHMLLLGLIDQDKMNHINVTSLCASFRSSTSCFSFRFFFTSCVVLIVLAPFHSSWTNRPDNINVASFYALLHSFIASLRCFVIPLFIASFLPCGLHFLWCACLVSRFPFGLKKKNSS